MPHMPRPALHLALALACALAGPAAHAEKADSRLPMEIQADRSGSADLQQQVSRFEGHVVLTQGTLLIKADRVEVRQTPEGYYQASAWGSPTAPVSYRQKREGVVTTVERQSKRQRSATPILFRDLLISIARNAKGAMAGGVGFEPTRSALTVQRSTD